MTTLIQDLRFALRLLAKSPGFTAIAVLTLAVAIGVNSAIFALVNGLILKPVVPYRSQEVVNLFTAKKDSNRDYRQFSYSEYSALREHGDMFQDVSAVTFLLVGIGRDEGMHRSFAFMVSDTFFPLMGVKPVAGRFFDVAESRPNANLPVAVASYDFWKKSGGRADFVGSTLQVNDRPYTVIGVAPKGFNGINALITPDLFLPLGIFSQISSAFSDSTQIADLADPKNFTLNVVARLKPGISLEAGRLRLPALAAQVNALQPAAADGHEQDLQMLPPTRFGISTTPNDDGPINLLGTLLLAMAGVVLVIASLNLANMLLARGTARAREMAVRLAVGATRWQIIRQLMVEGFVLAVLGGAVGVVLSYWSNTLLTASFGTLLSSMNFSVAADLTPDVSVLAATFIFCVLATVVFSVGPALQAARADVVHDLKAQAGDPAVRGRWNRFFAGRHLLVMAQMTLSLVLIFAAGLFVRGAMKAGGLDLGFDPQGVVMTEMDFSLANTAQPEGIRRMFAAAQRARNSPGVVAAGFTTLVPYGNITNTSRVVPANAAPVTKADPNAPQPGASGLYAAVTPGFFDAIGVKILRGRDFTEVEAREKNSPAVAIVDQELAEKLFPKQDALGQRIRYTQAPSDGSPAEMEIVGIVAAHRHDVSDSAGRNRRLYVPLAHAYNASAFLATRFSNEDAAATLAALPGLRRELRELDPTLPILQMLPFSYLLEKSIALWIIRLGAIMFGIFGTIALLLAVVGVYGVKAYAVERRTREIGIRMALGADRATVFALIMKQGAMQTLTSVVAGLVLSLLVGKALAAILYKVSPADPVAIILAVVVLTVATLLACYLPARRATKVSPMSALRME